MIKIKIKKNIRVRNILLNLENLKNPEKKLF